jgi:hypothetical protein
MAYRYFVSYTVERGQVGDVDKSEIVTLEEPIRESADLRALEEALREAHANKTLPGGAMDVHISSIVPWAQAEERGECGTPEFAEAPDAAVVGRKMLALRPQRHHFDLLIEIGIQRTEFGERPIYRIAWRDVDEGYKAEYMTSWYSDVTLAIDAYWQEVIDKEERRDRPRRR